MKFLNQYILGNSILNYLESIGVIVLAFLFSAFISKFISRIIFRLFKKYEINNNYDVFLQLVRKPFSNLVVLVSVYLALERLNFPAEWHLVPQNVFGIKYCLNKGYKVAIVGVLTWLLMRLIDYIAFIFIKKAQTTVSTFDDQIIPFFKESVKVLLVLFSFFFVLGAIFHINIASLIAGLGIGGLAIALAAKETLENLLGSFTIFLDKPFHVGDLIRFNNMVCVVERIGFRSTELRTIEKSLLTVPNKKLVDTEIENLSRREQRLVQFRIFINASTRLDIISKIIADIETYIQQHPNTSQEIKIKLDDFANGSISLLIFYYVNKIEWEDFIDIKHELNLKILGIIEKYEASLHHLIIANAK